MRRAALLIALVACEEPPPPPAPKPVAYAYPPPKIAWAVGERRGRFGRSQAPASVETLGIEGQGPPLRLPTVWQVPGKPIAIVYGQLDGKSAIERIDIDAGKLVWRDTKTCAGPIVGVTATTIVCSDAKGTHALAVENAEVDWETTEPFLAIDDDRVAIAGIGRLSLRKAEGGDELANVKLPDAVHATNTIASCADKSVYVVEDTNLVRVVDGKVAWSTKIGVPQKLDGCGATVLVHMPGLLVALARETGKPITTIDGVRDWWPARDSDTTRRSNGGGSNGGGSNGSGSSSGSGSGARIVIDPSDRIEVASSIGVTSYDRALLDPRATELPSVGELIATSGDRRLVRASALTAILLDRDGVRAYVPFAEMGGAIGDTAFLASSWQGSPSETLHRRALPKLRPHTVRVPRRPDQLAPAAELRDLPSIVDVTGDTDFILPNSGGGDLVAIALDPFDPTSLYAVNAVGIARADLATRRWRPAVGCNGEPNGLAIARDVVACSTKTGVAAIAKTTGGAGWTWSGATDRVAAAGEIVVAFDADVATILDARDGRAIATLVSDDGAAVRALPMQRGTETWLVSFERGALVARLPLAGMLPIWSLAVDGAIASLSESHDAILVALDDGDAYRIDPRGRIQSIAGIGGIWYASEELVARGGLGGVIYGPRPPAPPPPRFPIAVPPPAPIVGPFIPPPIATPLPMPPIIGRSWQLTLYDLDGALRVRNDYLINDDRAPVIAPRSPGAPIIIEHDADVNGQQLLVLDPRTGDPLTIARIPSPGRPLSSAGFSTIVDGKPFVGVVMDTPLRIVAIPLPSR